MPLPEPLIGSLGRRVKLAPGASAAITYVVTWYFPNLEMTKLGKVGCCYAQKYPSAQAVAEHVAASYRRLTEMTRLWRDTWYDSTLPYWFLDRTFLNISTLATSVCYRFADGRFYAYEGAPAPNFVGTCTHVWQYAQSVARIFPELERDTRQRVDLGIALVPKTGIIGFRGEYSLGALAVDGQAGTILRFYREHQMSPDNASSAQMGKDQTHIHPAVRTGSPRGWHSGRAAKQHARLCLVRAELLDELDVCRGPPRGRSNGGGNGRPAFAARCRTIAERGSRNIVHASIMGNTSTAASIPQYGYDELRRWQLYRSGIWAELGVSGRAAAHSAAAGDSQLHSGALEI